MTGRRTYPHGLLGMVLWGLTCAHASGQDAPSWDDVGALFAERCTMCHSGEAAPLGLHLDGYEAARAGSENGPVLVPGEPDASELVRRIRGESEPRMPLVGEPLSTDEIAMIERWVSEGLPEGEDASTQPASPPDEAAAPPPGEPVSFADVAPIFMQRCVMCHSDAAAESPPEGLRLDSYEHVLRGGERIVVVPGRPDHSELVRRIEGTADPRMPFDGPPWLSEDQIRVIREWIAQGAPNAEGDEAAMPAGGEVRFRGTLTGQWSIDGAEFLVDGGTRIDDRPATGEQAEMRGIIGEDGTIRATRLRGR